MECGPAASKMRPKGAAGGASTDLGSTIGESYFASYRNPYSEQWNLNIQYSLPYNSTIEVGYLGNHGLFLIDGDPGVPYSQLPISDLALGNAVGGAITKLGGSSWYFISFEYALGKALQRDASEAIIKSGGVVLGSVAHPLGVSDFSSYLLQAQASGAKVIALADTGADAINAIRQSADFHILDGGKQLAALFLQITDIDALGLQAANGLVLSEAFYWDMNDATRAFSARFAQRMEGRMPTEDQAAAYSETLAYLRAAKAANTIEGDKVVAQMRSAPIDDPLFGRVVVRPDGMISLVLALLSKSTLTAVWKPCFWNTLTAGW